VVDMSYRELARDAMTLADTRAERMVCCGQCAERVSEVVRYEFLTRRATLRVKWVCGACRKVLWEREISAIMD